MGCPDVFMSFDEVWSKSCDHHRHSPELLSEQVGTDPSVPKLLLVLCLFLFIFMMPNNSGQISAWMIATASSCTARR